LRAIARAQGPRQCAATCLPRERRPINRMSLIRGMFCVTGWQTDRSAQTRLFLLAGLNRIFSRITETETETADSLLYGHFFLGHLTRHPRALNREFTSRINFWNFAFLGGASSKFPKPISRVSNRSHRDYAGTRKEKEPDCSFRFHRVLCLR